MKCVSHFAVLLKAKETIENRIFIMLFIANKVEET